MYHVVFDVLTFNWRRNQVRGTGLAPLWSGRIPQPGEKTSKPKAKSGEQHTSWNTRTAVLTVFIATVLYSKRKSCNIHPHILWGSRSSKTDYYKTKTCRHDNRNKQHIICIRVVCQIRGMPRFKSAQDLSKLRSPQIQYNSSGNYSSNTFTN